MVAALAHARYISLTTFKRDGTGVSTPVWVVSDDGHRLLVWTGAQTWKVRRVQQTARVLVARSTIRGRERGERIEARARIVPDPGIDELLRQKYGWQKRLLDRLSRSGGGFVTIEIVDAP
jgi:PPOX class probable F420-dependent enzyme